MNSVERARRAGRIAALTCVLLAIGGRAQAMVVVKRDFPELVARAEQIVVGTVTDITYDKDEVGAPITLVTFSDVSVLKGDSGPTLTLRLSGGPDDDVAVHVSDMPTFTLGERNLLFIAGNGRDICPLVGVWQGRFRVRLDATHATEVVEHDDGSAVTGLVGRELQRTRRSADGSKPEPMPLDAFRQLIADELAHPHTGGDASR
jgi:hypothetical protein